MAFKQTFNETHTKVGVRDKLEVLGSADIKALSVDGSAITGADVAALAAQVRAYPIPLNAFNAPAAWKDALGDAPAAGIFGLSDTPGDVLKGELSNANSKTDEAQNSFVLPPEYVAGGAITVRIRAKKDTTLAFVGDTIDCNVKLVGDTLGSDLVTTSPQTPMTTAYVDYDFVVTPTGLVPGNILSLIITGISNDTGGATNKAIWVSRVEMRILAN